MISLFVLSQTVLIPILGGILLGLYLKKKELDLVKQEEMSKQDQLLMFKRKTRRVR